jgi:hypothetical protein
MAHNDQRPHTVILDSEAVQALKDATHPKHRKALAIVQAVNGRRRQRADSPRIVVPVAVRIEAGWDRTHRSAAAINWLTGADDWILSTERTNQAAKLRDATGVSVVDATVGQVAQEVPHPVTIITSDVDDMTRIAQRLGKDIRVARL